jgi:CRP-like cAMP-binding protein
MRGPVLPAKLARRARKKLPSGSVQEFPARAVLFDSKHPAPKIFLVRSGWIQLLTGENAILDCLGPGAVFGERSFLGRAADSLAARALTSVRVTTFEKSQLLERLQADRGFALRLLKALAARTHRYEQAIADFIADPAEIRLARLLARALPPKPTSGWVRLPYELSHRALAKTIGTSRWRIALFMRRFRESGWLRRDGGLWIERSGLREFLSGRRR